MTPTDDDAARPIPQRRPDRPGRDRADDVDVVDTRRGVRRTPPARTRRVAPQPAPPPASGGRPRPVDRDRRVPAAYPVDGGRQGTGTRALPTTPRDRQPGRVPAAGGPAGPRQPVARPDGSGAGPGPSRGRRRARLAVGVVSLLVVAWLAWMIWVPIHAWNGVSRIDADPGGSRPAASKGHNYLLVGSDSRANLSSSQTGSLHTGTASQDPGARTDSIILVHVPASGGKASLISIPRDSYVPIPGHDSNKINASFAIGGPKLLISTIEHATDLRIDGYLEIGFAGFANVVDSLGGVTICVPFHMDDPKAGINLQKGCQLLNGPNALGFVRARYSDPRGDIGRAERQRQFLGAIMKKAATASTVLIPTRYYTFADSAAGAIQIDKKMSMSDAYSVLQTMRGAANGSTLSYTVPIQTESLQTRAGLSIKWNTPLARALFTALRNDTPLDAPPAGTDGKPSQ